MAKGSPNTPELENDELLQNDVSNDVSLKKPTGEQRCDDSGRRMFLRVGTLGALALVFGMAKPAEAQEPPRFDDEPTWTQEQMDTLTSSAEQMRPAEVERMQKSQEAIFRGYLNLPLTAYSYNRKGEKNIIDTAMIAAMKYPFDLKYLKGNNGMITVIKKPNSGNAELPDDLEIQVDGSGHMVKVNGVPIPVFSQDEYDRLGRVFDKKQMENSFTNGSIAIIKQLASLGISAANPSILQIIFQATWSNMPGDIKRLFENNHIIFPSRFRQCIEARNAAHNFDGIKNNPAYSKFVEMLDQHAANYDDMASNFPDKNKVWLEFDEHSGVYIFNNAESESSGIPPIAITREGYLLPMTQETVDTEDLDGNPTTKTIFVPSSTTNPVYRDRIKTLYYEQFPAAADLKDLKGDEIN